MGRRKINSSESDDDDNSARHDRFTSERFKDSTLDMNVKGSTKSNKYNHDKHSNKRYRERSPHRARHEKIEKSYREESRNKCDNLSHHSISNKFEKHDLRDHLRTHSQKKPSDEPVKDSNDCSSSMKSSKKLSSILMNFDKKVESKRFNSVSLSQIGPSLPPHLTHKGEEEEEEPVESITDTSVGPALPPHLRSNIEEPDSPDSLLVSNHSDEVVETKFKSGNSCKNIDQTVEQNFLFSMGPELPPHLKNQTIKKVENTDIELHSTINEKTKSLSPSVIELEEKLKLCGPALPPKSEEESFGPALPPNLEKRSVQGPMLPSGITSDDLERMGEEESEDEDTFGPLPEGKMNMTQYQLELRAMDIKRKLEEEKNGSSKDIKKREEWMLELPPEKASNLGLGPRSFRMKEGPDMSNRSAWTDTPAEKKRKEEMALRGEAEPVNSEEVMRSAFVKERNETMEKISTISQDEDRQKSLLEIHQKKLKKKKKKEEKEGKKKERRPFDRNIDLQVHRFDEAQKKAIFKKAQLLDTRFSSGESKYL